MFCILASCNPPDPINNPGGKKDGIIPTKTLNEIESKLGENYEINISVESESSVDGNFRYTSVVLKDGGYLFYEGNVSETGENEKYLLKDDNLYIFSSDNDKYLLLPTSASSDLKSYLTGYQALCSYSTITTWPFNEEKDIRFLSRSAKEYKYEGLYEGKNIKLILIIDKETGLCLKLELESTIDGNNYFQKIEVKALKTGSADLSHEISLISTNNEKTSKIYVGKTKEEIIASLGDNYTFEFEGKEDGYNKNCVVKKSGNAMTFEYVAGSYNDIMLVIDDVYWIKKINEDKYLYSSHYVEGENSTSANDMQGMLFELIEHSSNIEYQEKEDVSFLGRNCTKLFNDAPRPYTYSQIVREEYIIDNLSGLCLKYSSTTGFDETSLYTQTIETKGILFNKVNLDDEISKTYLSDWPTESIFQDAMLMNVEKPSGMFYDSATSLTDTSANATYSIRYFLNSKEEYTNLVSAFYNAGCKFNDGEREVAIEELYKTNTNEETVFYGHTSNTSFVEIKCVKTSGANTFDVRVFIGVCDYSEHKHTYGDATYTWSSDFSKCTATRVCLKDSTHIETETVDTIKQVVQSQSCGKPELTTFFAYFKNYMLGTQSKTNVETKPALEHKYDLTVVNSRYIKTDASCTSKAIYYKSCECGEFIKDDNNTFEAGEALGHNYEFVEFVWAQDDKGYTAKAKFICTHDLTHEVFETAIIEEGILQEAFCHIEGLIKYTAKVIFEEAEYYEDKEVSSPKNNDNHTYYTEDKVEPTCIDEGKEAIIKCEYCDYQSGGDVLPSLGHKYSSEYYSQDEDKHASYCEICGNEKIESCTFSTIIKFDEYNHFYECDKCGNHKDEKEHEYLNGACSCGKKDSNVCIHEYEDGNDEYNHFSICKHCLLIDEDSLEEHIYDLEVVDDKYLVEITQDNKYIYYRSCKCGHYNKDENNTFIYTKGEGDKCEHEYLPDMNETYHYNKCHKCGEIEPFTEEEHIYNLEVVDDKYLVEITQDNKYIYYRSCKCGHYNKDENNTFVYSKEVDDYEFLEFSWEKENDKWVANAVFISKSDESLTKKERADVSSEVTIIANCSFGGEIVYTAVYKEYSGTYTEETSIDEDAHDFKVLDYDDDFHFYICELCSAENKDSRTSHIFENKIKEGFLVEEASCSNGNLYYKSCDCGKKSDEVFENGDALPHEWSDYLEWEWAKDGISAKVILTCINNSDHHSEVNAIVEKISSKISSCIEEGYIVYSGKVVINNETFKDEFTYYLDNDINNHSINESEYYEYDEEYHAYKCENCNEFVLSTKTLHKWDDGEVTYESSCSEFGVKTFTCLDCGCQKTEELPKKPHTFEYGIIDWDSEGHFNMCDNCEFNDLDTKTAHEFDENHYCACGAFDSLACEHDFCLANDDYTHYQYCPNCRTIKNKENHDYGNSYEVINEATCYSTGEIKYTCSVCNHEKYVETEKVPHVIDDSYYDWDYDDHWHCCQNCYEIIEETIEKHNFNDGKLVEEGDYKYKKYSCKDCEFWYTLDLLD